ncbi:MAG: hypothetical protein KDM91_13170 [Verrucomicrobiae bacterium]|nr:hypothetical protein [Verrucomicrobiae bacterium]
MRTIPERPVSRGSLWFGLLTAGAIAFGGEPEGRAPRIQPATPVLPANFLKFYLHFPEPMERGEVFAHCRLLRLDDGGGEVEVEDPFREVELWDESFTRLTLWFHPGRQKPGLNLNVDFGTVLEPGKRYRLEIDPAWRTESGHPIGEGWSKTFTASAMDETQPSPAKWRIAWSAELGGPVLIADETLDPSSLAKFLRIRRAGPEETTSEPASAAWLASESGGARYRLAWPDMGVGAFELIVDPRVEDLAGNSPARPFNLDLEKRPNSRERTEPIVIGFELPETATATARE